MKNIFSRTKKDTPPPADNASVMPSSRALRESITGFIIQSLQPYVDEPSHVVAGLHFYMICKNRQEEEAAKIALYADNPGLFRELHLDRTLANHFIQLTPACFFEWHIVKETLPEDSLQKDHFGLKILGAGDQVPDNYSKARLQVLSGQTAQAEYQLDPEKQLKYYIGRGKTPQLSTGKIQQNDIVFTGREEAGFDELTGKANLHVSRNHAYIVYETRSGRYLLYPDKGGLPDSGSKLKVHTADDKVKWLNIYGVPHCLTNGDQVELGGEAVLRFIINW